MALGEGCRAAELADGKYIRTSVLMKPWSQLILLLPEIMCDKRCMSHGAWGEYLEYHLARVFVPNSPHRQMAQLQLQNPLNSRL